ncbi:hypothetical protein D3C76_1812570 [compost metagenome]
MSLYVHTIRRRVLHNLPITGAQQLFKLEATQVHDWGRQAVLYVVHQATTHNHAVLFGHRDRTLVGGQVVAIELLPGKLA